MSLELSRVMGRQDRIRQIKSVAMMLLLNLLSLAAISPLFIIFIYVIHLGASSISWEFFTALPVPVGETGGGLANAFVGSVIMLVIALIIGVPVGLASGTFFSEYYYSKTAKVTRFGADILLSVPSIVVGLFVYGLIVVPLKNFSALAGGISLAIIMIPIVSRGTEEILRLVPNHVREAGLALGLSRWRVIWSIIVKGSKRPLITIVMLALARVAGETAPLLFTSFGNQFWSTDLFQPIAALPVQIYVYAISPFEEWKSHAWGAALVLVTFVFLSNFFTRLILKERVRKV